jgi:hypothetical protein
MNGEMEERPNVWRAKGRGDWGRGVARCDVRITKVGRRGEPRTLSLAHRPDPPDKFRTDGRRRTTQSLGWRSGDSSELTTMV